MLRRPFESARYAFLRSNPWPASFRLSMPRRGGDAPLLRRRPWAAAGACHNAGPRAEHAGIRSACAYLLSYDGWIVHRVFRPWRWAGRRTLAEYGAVGESSRVARRFGRRTRDRDGEIAHRRRRGPRNNRPSHD